MKQPDGRKQRKKADREKADASQASPAVSYTPEQRRLIRNGLGIWARVAIRSYLRQRGEQAQPGTEPIEEDQD